MTGAPGPDPTAASYDAVADEYAARFGDELAGKPLDRALLASLAERAGSGAPAADLGCGPGHVTARLAELGLAAVGIDLSPRMVTVARRACPRAEFRVGDLRDLPAADGEFSAVVALYSIIHLPPADLSLAFGQMRRVLRPGGLLLLAFHAGAEVRHLDEFLGHPVDLDFRFFQPADIEARLERAGLTVEMTMERRHYPAEAQTRRGYLLARRPD